jgi:hypothetical protein
MPDRYCLFEKLGFSVYHLIKKDVCVKYLSKNIFRMWRYLHLKLTYFSSIAKIPECLVACGPWQNPLN